MSYKARGYKAHLDQLGYSAAHPVVRAILCACPAGTLKRVEGESGFYYEVEAGTIALIKAAAVSPDATVRELGMCNYIRALFNLKPHNKPVAQWIDRKLKRDLAGN